MDQHRENIDTDWIEGELLRREAEKLLITSEEEPEETKHQSEGG
jgi:hypothetical protein